MIKHPPEEAVAVVGSLIIVLGVNALLRTFFAGTFDISFIALWFGYGIWQGKKNSRGVVLAISVLTLLIAGLAGLFYLLRDATSFAIENLEGMETWPDRFVLMGIFLVLSYIIWTLSRPDVKALFERNEPIIVKPRPLLISVVAVSSLLLGAIFIAHRVQQTSQDQLINNIYSYDTLVKLYDKETGERLSSIETQSPIRSFASDIRAHPKWTRVSSTVNSDEEGLYRTLEGIAIEPLEFIIRAEGYEETTIIIDEETEDELRIELTPLPASEEQPPTENSEDETKSAE